MALRNPQHVLPKTSSDEHFTTHAGSSSSSIASADGEGVHLTPDFDTEGGADDGDDDSDSDSDLDMGMGMGMGMGMRGGERRQNDSYKMQRWQPVQKERGKFNEGQKFEALDADADVDMDMDSDEDHNEDVYRDETGRRRGSLSTIQSYQLYTPDEERAVVRKFDRKLVVFVALLYMLSFLDRSSNICIHLLSYTPLSSPLSSISGAKPSVLTLSLSRYRECEDSRSRTRFTLGFE